MIVNYRDKRTRDFAEGRRVKAFDGIKRAAEMKLDQLEAATALEDLNLPGNRLELLKKEHTDQRPMAGLLRVAGWLFGADQRGDRRLSLRGCAWHEARFTRASTSPSNFASWG